METDEDTVQIQQTGGSLTMWASLPDIERAVPDIERNWSQAFEGTLYL